MKKWIGLLALLMLALVCATALGETNTQVKHYLMLGEDGYAEHVTDDARTDTIVLVSLDTKYAATRRRSTCSIKTTGSAASSPVWSANWIFKSRARFWSTLKT